MSKITFLILFVAVSVQHRGVNADQNQQNQNGNFRLQKLPRNLNHNHKEHDLTDLLSQIRREDDKQASSEENINSRRLINQFSPDSHILTEREFQKCIQALSVLDRPNLRAFGREDSSEALNEDNANNAPFHYQALRRSSSDNSLDQHPNANDLNKQNNKVQSVADPPTPAGSPLTNYDFSRRMMLLKNKRVCYACSSASNPTCENPDRSTTIKYCSPDQDVCVIKSYYTHAKTKVIVRDCANSCKDPDPLNIAPKYKKCSLCKEDLCNAAHYVSGKTAIFIGTIYALFAIFRSM